MKLDIRVILLFCVTARFSECARILGIFPFASRSHHILGSSLMQGLAEAGHDVTIISVFEDKVSLSNGSYRQIILTGFLEEYQEKSNSSDLFNFGDQKFASIFFLNHMTQQLTEPFFNHTNVQKLLNSNEKFDAIVLHMFGSDAAKIFSHRFEAPLILFSSIGANSLVNRQVGNPEPASYIPYMLSDFPTKMSFYQRLQNTLFYTFDHLVCHLYNLPSQNSILKKYFTNPPDMTDLYYNVSLVLINSHESLTQSVPLVPNMVQIGGYHIKPPKKLPKDLQVLLDNAKEGVIYFSFGSNLKSKDLTVEKREAFLKAFGKLKQKVLWKWEDDELPGKPSNVIIQKWLPQQAILAHPNVKLFITHGGLLSTTETVYYGVPIIAIPVFADQHLNANAAVSNGYGLSLAFHDPTFSEEKLSDLIDKILRDSAYTINVQKASRIFHDRPMKPMDSAVYWVEYIIRHKGAPHLRVAGVNLHWYQYFLLDVFACLSVSVILSCIVLYLVIKKLCRRKGQDKLKEN